MSELADKIVARGLELGFDRVVIVPLREPETVPQFEQWLAEGRHGEMSYLEKYHDVRVGQRELEPNLTTAIALWANYNQPLEVAPGGLRIARYALGDDYHEVLRARVDALRAFIHAETGVAVGTRGAVDTAPILERDLARRAGLGWVGKNTMLINAELGSYGFLAELYVELDIAAEPAEPHPKRCGTCTACIDACPTGAIVSPHVLDARRCISYLTIELRGPIPRPLRPLIGDRVYGCDICQEVCPWNRDAPVSKIPEFAIRPAYEGVLLTDLLRFTHDDYVELFRRSPIKRAKYRGLLRNAAVVLGNLGDPSAIPALTDALRDNPEPLVRGHAAWALGQLGALDALVEARAAEADAYVLDEIDAATPS